MSQKMTQIRPGCNEIIIKPTVSYIYVYNCFEALDTAPMLMFSVTECIKLAMCH